VEINIKMTVKVLIIKMSKLERGLVLACDPSDIRKSQTNDSPSKA